MKSLSDSWNSILYAIQTLGKDFSEFMSDSTQERRRLSRDDAFMLTAKIWSLRATCNRKQVGAVIVKDNRIISVGYNGAPSGMDHCTNETCNEESGSCTHTIHAEENALLFAAKWGISVEGATIYTTTEPCLNCSKSMINAGISKLVYHESYGKGVGLELLDQAGLEYYQWLGDIEHTDIYEIWRAFNNYGEDE